MPRRTPQEQLQKYQLLKDYLNSVFYEPDIRALDIALSQYVAHFWFDRPPIWTFVLGASSSGKSSIILKAISFLPQTVEVDLLTTSSFLSGFGKNEGLLDNLTSMGDGSKRRHGIVLISDFSTVLNMQHEQRAEIQSQLRTIYDGFLTKKVGNKDVMLKWEGKVTVIAACTPSLERYWGLGHDLGERFLMYKMTDVKGREKRIEMSSRSIDSMLKSKAHMKKFRDLVVDFVAPQESVPITQISSKVCKDAGLLHVGELLSTLRQNVIRDTYGKRDIVSVESPESPTRLIQALVGVAQGRAALFRRQITLEDINFAKILGITSSPSKRFSILSAVVRGGGTGDSLGGLSYQDIATSTGIPHTSAYRFIEELQVLGMVKVTQTGQKHIVSLSEDSRYLIEYAKILRVRTPPKTREILR